MIELLQRVKAGHPFLAIERDWEARGIVNKSCRPFSAQHLRSMCTRKAYIGIRVHKGGELPASWPVVVADYPGSPMIVGCLSRPDVYRMITPEDGGAELEAVRSQLAAKRADSAELRCPPDPSSDVAHTAV